MMPRSTAPSVPGAIRSADLPDRGALQSLSIASPAFAPPAELRKVFLALVFVAGYVALDWLSFIHPMEGFNITPWNPQPALAIALLMIAGFRWLPIVFIALLASEWLGRGAAAPIPAMLLIGAVLCCGYGLIAKALVGVFRIQPSLDSQRDAVRLIAVTGVGALVTGALFITALQLSSIAVLHDPMTALVRFWIGDAVGIVVTLPLILMLSVEHRRRQIAKMLRERETWLHIGLVGLAMMLVFAVRAEDFVKFFYVLFLPLIVVAARLGLVGSTFAALGLQCAVIVGGELSNYQALTIFEAQALLIALTATGLFLGVTVDERRRAEQELGRSSRMAAAGEMAAALAHELNQPLAAVSSYARASQIIVRNGAVQVDLLTETLSKLVAESGRAAEVVQRLRDFFMAGEMNLVPIAMGQLAHHVVDRLTPLWPRAVIEVAETGIAPLLLADRTQMAVVLRNLLTNALEATALEPSPKVILQVVATASFLEVAIRDNGPGVPEADVDRIFEPFETSRATGMGMGLAICRALVEAHGGRVWTEAGRGGRFRFTLPYPDEPHE